MNNTARSIKISIILVALVLGLAQFFVHQHPQSSPTSGPRQFEYIPVRCADTFCSVDPAAVVPALDYGLPLDFTAEGVTLSLNDFETHRFIGLATFTQKGAIVSASAMTRAGQRCSDACPGTCKTHEDEQEYCHITFRK